MLGGMTAREAVEVIASARVDPDEGERADVRWALQMEALHAFAGARRPLPPLYWLQRLPWRDEFVTAEERARREAARERAMAEFARRHREAKGV